jgi:hypothetical protein
VYEVLCAVMLQRSSYIIKSHFKSFLGWVGLSRFHAHQERNRLNSLEINAEFYLHLDLSYKPN